MNKYIKVFFYILFLLICLLFLWLDYFKQEGELWVITGVLKVFISPVYTLILDGMISSLKLFKLTEYIRFGTGKHIYNTLVVGTGYLSWFQLTPLLISFKKKKRSPQEGVANSYQKHP